MQTKNDPKTIQRTHPKKAHPWCLFLTTSVTPQPSTSTSERRPCSPIAQPRNSRPWLLAKSVRGFHCGQCINPKPQDGGSYLPSKSRGTENTSKHLNYLFFGTVKPRFFIGATGRGSWVRKCRKVRHIRNDHLAFCSCREKVSDKLAPLTSYWFTFLRIPVWIKMSPSATLSANFSVKTKWNHT